MIAYCVVGTVVIARDIIRDKIVVLYLQRSQSDDGESHKNRYLYYSTVTVIQRNEKWPKKALLAYWKR